MNPITSYYVEQAGSGIAGFQGIKFQRGSGLWSNIWAKVGLPVLKFLGRAAATSGLNIASDALEGGDIKQSAIRELKSGGKQGVALLRDMISQKGQGRKRKRRTSVKPRKGIKKTKVVKKRSVAKRKPKRKQRRRKFNFDF